MDLEKEIEDLDKLLVWGNTKIEIDKNTLINQLQGEMGNKMIEHLNELQKKHILKKIKYVCEKYFRSFFKLFG
jgi:hypothetical protein